MEKEKANGMLIKTIDNIPTISEAEIIAFKVRMNQKKAEEVSEKLSEIEVNC